MSVFKFILNKYNLLAGQTVCSVQILYNEKKIINDNLFMSNIIMFSGIGVWHSLGINYVISFDRHLLWLKNTLEYQWCWMQVTCWRMRFQTSFVLSLMYPSCMNTSRTEHLVSDPV